MGKHLLLFEFTEVEVAFIPSFKGGELIVGRHEWMCLAIALDLRCFIEPLPARPLLGVLPVNRFACK